MKEPRNFFSHDPNIGEPWQIAVQGLVEMDLTPGDIVQQREITALLGMIDEDEITDAAEFKRFTMARWPQVEKLIEGFEDETGLTLMANHRGAYLVIEPEEVAQVVMEATGRKLHRLLKWATGKLNRASNERASAEELQRRSDAVVHLQSLRQQAKRARAKG